MIAVWRSFSVDARRFLLGSLLLELGHGFLWALQNLYVRSVGHGDVEVGAILSAGGVGVVLSTIPAATLYDRLGARTSMTLAACVTGTAMALLAFSTHLWVLMISCAMLWSSFTLHHVVAAPFIVSTVDPDRRTHLFSAEFATHTIASTLGLVLAGLTAQRLEDALGTDTVALRIAILTGALISAAAALAYMRIGAEARAAAKDPPDETEGPEPPRVADEAVRRTLDILKPAQWHLWWRLALPHGLVGLGAGLTIPFINLYFTDRFDVDKDTLGLVMSGSQVTMTVSLLGMPWLVRRLGLLQSTILSELLSLPFFLILAFTMSLPVAVLAFVLRTAFMNLSHPLWRNLMMEITPVRWRAAVNGVGMLAWNLGWALSNHGGGWLLAESEGWLGPGTDAYTVPMLITTGVYLVAILLEARFFWHVRHVGRVGATPAVDGGESPAP